MPAGSLTPALQQFIARYVHSVEQVEILCLVQADPARSWSVNEVFHAIQSSESSVTATLNQFQQAGLLNAESPGTYRFSPKTAELEQAVTELARAYRERRVTVVETIYRKPSEAIQDFADAFKLRKGK